MIETLKELALLPTNSIAFAIWCLQTPPPRIIIPAFLECTDMSFNLLMSPTISMINPGFLYEWKYNMSPREPSVRAGQNTGMSFCEGGIVVKKEKSIVV